jgi:acetylornithine deacetylase/succinyl-diaminopimelate desuccinylase-like protein
VEKLAHKIDEYIEIDQLIGAAGSYYGVMKALLK